MILEAVIVTLKPEVTEERFAESVRSSEKFLKAQTGFLHRRLLRETEHGKWIDLVYWATPADAERAMEQSMRDPLMCGFADLFDEVIAGHYVHLPLDAAAAGFGASSADDLVEFVTFKPADDADIGELRDVLAAIGDAAQQVPGFRGRSLFHDESSGVWADLMRYDNREAGEKLYALIKETPSLSRAFSLMDPSSVRMHFATEASVTA